MQEPPNPSKAFWEWFSALPVRHRETVAQIVMTSLPDYPRENIVDAAKMEADFSSYFAFGNGLPSREIAKLLTLRAVIDFFVVTRMTASGAWEKDRSFWEYVLAEHPEFAAEAGEYLRRIPFESALWIKTRDSWRALCAAELSDEALRRFMDDLHLRKAAGWAQRLQADPAQTE